MFFLINYFGFSSDCIDKPVTYAHTCVTDIGHGSVVCIMCTLLIIS